MLFAILGVVALLSFGAWTALKPRLRARPSAASRPSQPVPDVTQDDVVRVIHRDFPDARFEDVMPIVAEYTSQWENAAPRVQLAALKLANGNLDSLRRHIAAAKLDYRDVLVAAEYPQYWKATSRPGRLTKSESQEFFDADWQRYQSWLHK
jgi:hypothetical protein